MSVPRRADVTRRVDREASDAEVEGRRATRVRLGEVPWDTVDADRRATLAAVVQADCALYRETVEEWPAADDALVERLDAVERAAAEADADTLRAVLDELTAVREAVIDRREPAFVAEGVRAAAEAAGTGESD